MAIWYHYLRYGCPGCHKEDSVYDAACTALAGLEYNLSWPIKITDGRKIIWRYSPGIDISDELEALKK